MIVDLIYLTDAGFDTGRRETLYGLKQGAYVKCNWNKTKQFYFSFISAARTWEMKLKQNSWNSFKTVSELFQAH